MKWTVAWWVTEYTPTDSPVANASPRNLGTGGANEAVIRMLISIGSPENVPAFVEAVKRREKVLSGFGHR